MLKGRLFIFLTVMIWAAAAQAATTSNHIKDKCNEGDHFENSDPFSREVTVTRDADSNVWTGKGSEICPTDLSIILWNENWAQMAREKDYIFRSVLIEFRLNNDAGTLDLTQAIQPEAEGVARSRVAFSGYVWFAPEDGDKGRVIYGLHPSELEKVRIADLHWSDIRSVKLTPKKDDPNARPVLAAQKNPSGAFFTKASDTPRTASHAVLVSEAPTMPIEVHFLENVAEILPTRENPGPSWFVNVPVRFMREALFENDPNTDLQVGGMDYRALVLARYVPNRNKVVIQYHFNTMNLPGDKINKVVIKLSPNDRVEGNLSGDFQVEKSKSATNSIVLMNNQESKSIAIPDHHANTLSASKHRHYTAANIRVAYNLRDGTEVMYYIVPHRGIADGYKIKITPQSNNVMDAELSYNLFLPKNAVRLRAVVDPASIEETNRGSRSITVLGGIDYDKQPNVADQFLSGTTAVKRSNLLPDGPLLTLGGTNPDLEPVSNPEPDSPLSDNAADEAIGTGDVGGELADSNVPEPGTVTVGYPADGGDGAGATGSCTLTRTHAPNQSAGILMLLIMGLSGLVCARKFN